MIDTLHIWAGKKEGAGSDDLLACLPHLDEVSEVLKDNRITFFGRAGNYKVNIYEHGISLKGSLAKYHFNDNMQTLTRSETARAFERLEDDLHLSLQDAQVTRIDIAQNLLMNYEPQAYYSYLGDSQHYQRLLQPKSLYYSNQQRVKLFYNKLAEVSKQKRTIPEVLSDQNVLRYELRFMKRIPKQLKRDVTVNQLYSEPFYIEMLNRWVSEYKSIHKMRIINLDPNTMKTPKDFWKQGNLHWIKLIGQETAMQLVEDMRSRQAFDKPEYYSRLKREIKELCSQPDITEASELINELDEKVTRVQMYYR